VTHPWDVRPVVVGLVGPNGAGKSTFYQAHLREAGLRFVNADEIGRELGLDAYSAAKVADKVRRELAKAGESFVFETVFSDPVGEKLAFLSDVATLGYNVVLCFIGLADAAQSEERVTMRVLMGGHDVPTDKIESRYPRVLQNLDRALRDVPCVLVFDNSDLRRPYRLVAETRKGELVQKPQRLPEWLRKLPYFVEQFGPLCAQAEGPSL
jgi:predicted ABC-type ATPase